MLVKRGKDHLMNGDICLGAAVAAARRRGRQCRSRAGARLNVRSAGHRRLGAIGVETDAAKARKWYQKAAALGSNLASEQLAKLAEAGR